MCIRDRACTLRPVCVTKLLLTSKCRTGDAPARSLVSGNTERSLYRVLRGSSRGALRSVDREYAGRNATSVKGSSPDNQAFPWWPSQYEEAKAASTGHGFQLRSVAYASSDCASPRRSFDTTGVQDHGMYTRPAAERERSARSRTNGFGFGRHAATLDGSRSRVGGQGFKSKSTPTILRAEVRCARSSAEVG